MCPETMLTITRCDKATAKLMADNALNRSPEWFYETYGVLWPMKWFSSIIAFFVWDELRYMGAAAQTVSGCKERMTIDRIRRRYDAAELPADLWIGDTTVDMLIRKFRSGSTYKYNIQGGYFLYTKDTTFMELCDYISSDTGYVIDTKLLGTKKTEVEDMEDY